MKRGGPIVLVGLALAALAVVVTLQQLRLGPFAGPQRPAPVVIFVVIDTLRADRTSLCLTFQIACPAPRFVVKLPCKDPIVFGEPTHRPLHVAL